MSARRVACLLVGLAVGVTACGTSSAKTAAEPSVALEADGLGFVTDATTGHLDHVPFETAQAATKSAVRAALGAPQSDTAPVKCEDGSGRSFAILRYPALTVSFLDGTFRGWIVDQRGLTTVDGTGVGSTLAQLRSSFSGVTVSDTSLGHEFTAGTVGGLLDGTASTAKVTTIWAGDQCFIR